MKMKSSNYISIELTEKAGEVIVLEILGEQIPGESHGVPDDEGRSVVVP